MKTATIAPLHINSRESRENRGTERRFRELTVDLAVSGDHARRSAATDQARRTLMLNPDGSWYTTL